MLVLTSSATDLSYYDGEMAIRPAPDVVAPSVPGSVLAEPVSASSMRLSCAASTEDVGVVGYRVFRDDRLVAEVAGTVRG